MVATRVLVKSSRRGCAGRRHVSRVNGTIILPILLHKKQCCHTEASATFASFRVKYIEANWWLPKVCAFGREAIVGLHLLGNLVPLSIVWYYAAIGNKEVLFLSPRLEVKCGITHCKSIWFEYLYEFFCYSYGNKTKRLDLRWWPDKTFRSKWVHWVITVIISNK